MLASVLSGLFNSTSRNNEFSKIIAACFPFLIIRRLLEYCQVFMSLLDQHS